MATHETDTHTGNVDMEEEFGLGARMGKSLVKGILIGLPISYVGLVVALLLMTERDFVRSIETAVLPGLLIGVFFGGFFGMAIMLLGVEREERRAKSRRRQGK
ncbi:MAG: hypothetical protein ACFCVC_10840 [Acidimicrobiia bacterium]